MKALRLALTAARLAGRVLPRDETSAPRRDGSTFDYPSDSSLQQAAHGLLAHGLLLEFGGWTLGEGTITCAWTLTHIESGESQTHVLEWPLFTDMPQRAHAAAAAISHAWRHLVMQLLGLRVEPRRVQLPAVVDDLSPALGGRGIPTPPPTRTLAKPAAYSPEALDDLVVWWSLREQEHDQAEGRDPTARTVEDAWAGFAGGRPRAPYTDTERCWLFERLRDEQCRRGA